MSLGELAESVDYGVTASASQQPIGPKFLRITDIQDGAVDWDGVPWCECDERSARDAQLDSGDIVFARTGATTGKSFLIRVCPTKTVFASYLIRVRLGRSAEPSFVRHFFQTPNYWAQITKSARGLAQPGVNATTLKALSVPLPPLPEQRRIAEVLDRAEALRAKRRAALAQLDTLTQSIFLDMFGEELDAPAIGTQSHRANVPKGCSWDLLTDVARLATGHTPDREMPEYWNGDVPWISLTDIRDLDGTIATSTLQHVTLLGIKNSSSVLLPKGTVCFSRTASVGFVTTMGRDMATSQDFMNWVCGPSLDPAYLMWALITSRQRLLALSSGSTHRTIYMRVVEQFRVLRPPINAQRQFARRVAGINKLKKSQRAALAELDGLFESLQYRAFRGEL